MRPKLTQLKRMKKMMLKNSLNGRPTTFNSLKGWAGDNPSYPIDLPSRPLTIREARMLKKKGY